MQSIQLSTVAIGTITFSAFPIFTSFLEPLFFKEKFKIRNVIYSILMLTGIFIIASASNNQESTGKIIGVIIGLVSSIAYAALSLFNRYFSPKYKPEIIVFYEQAIAAIAILPFIFIIKPIITGTDFFLLAILGIIFTAFAHGLFVKGLRHIKVSTAGIISGLEAVYSIILASFLLKEIPLPNEIIGGLIVIIIAGCMTIFKEK
jgi:drug/metabolite transporter (DMT)-like permease